MKLKNNVRLLITCDSGAAAGKTTAAKYLSKKFGLHLLTSGLLYRFVSLKLLESKKTTNDITFLKKITKNINSKLLKNKKLFSNLNKKCFYFQKSLNQFIIKERIKAKVYRFDSILRIVFSKKEIKDRIQRDFFEKKNISNTIKFRQYLLENKIYYPSNGIIFLSNSTSYKSINYVLEYIKFGLKKFF